MKSSRVSVGGQNRGELCLMACESGKPLANRILHHLNKILITKKHDFEINMVESQEVTFANGEIKTIIEDNVRGADVYIVQSADDPNSKKSINDNLMALMTAINAAFQSDADSITVISPQYPYSRQERKKTRESLTAKQIASFMEISGAERVITLDIHAEAIQGFFNHARLEDLHASKTLISYMKEHFPINNLIVAAADVLRFGGQCFFIAERRNRVSRELLHNNPLGAHRLPPVRSQCLIARKGIRKNTTLSTFSRVMA